MNSAAKILAVDDEPRALELVVRTLRKVGDVTTAASGDAALALMATESFDLVISDQRMPGLSGVDLLSHVAERTENCGRILLTGYADLSATIEAINRGRVHAYLHKPCSPEELRVCVLNVLARARLAQENARLVAVVTEQGSELQASGSFAQDESLAAIGKTIAAGVADLHAPIAALRIAGAETQRLARELTHGELAERGDEIVAGTDQLQRICSDLLQVTRGIASDRIPS